MDSPERNQIVTSTSSSASPQVQDSPFFNFASSLSPIKPFKGVRSAQGFSELSFPPPVFTSPRINAQRETSFLKRSTCPHSSTTKLTLEQDSRDKIIISGSLVSEPATMQSVVGFIPGSQKVHNNKGPVQVKSCSLSGSVDEYLADPVEMEDCANSTNLADVSIIQVRDQTEAAASVCTSSKETTMKLDDDGPTKVLDAEVVASLALERVEEDLLPKSLIPVKSVDSECVQKTYELPSTKSIDIISEKANDLVEPDPSLEPVSGAQQCHHLEADLATKDFPFLSKKKEHDCVYSGEEKPARSRILIRYGSRAVKLPRVEDRMQDKLDSTPQMLPDYLPAIQADENHEENSGAKSKGSVEDRILYDSEEGSQYQRGTLRRCLQFEAAEGQGNTNLNSQNSWNSQTDVLLNSSSPQSPKDLEIMHSSHQKSRLTSSNKRAVNFSEPITSRSPFCQVEMPEIDKSFRNSVSSSVISPMPSGIGLHLNSIVNAAATVYDTTANMKFVEKGCSNVHGEKPPSVFDCSLPGDSMSSPISTSLVELFSNYDNNQHESLDIVTTRSATFQSSRDLQCISKSLQLEFIEYNSTPLDKVKSSSENADRFEEFNQPFSQKKRKRMSPTIENDGCKRCNCKKSKCLKLYCECFAAGVYCSEPCSCLECYNKPEHEDTVLGTRQQIESRNPLAFAPKIVKRVNESPVNSVEEGNRMTPASARHKRGCNCKKSMCLKKYCECYQAGVGCSDGCRCEGCKNTFGIKEGYGESRDLHTKADSERWEDSSDDKLDMAKIKFDQLYPEQRPQKLSPLTPLFQSSNHGKDTNKSRIITRRYVPSPESDRPKTGERTLDVACYDPESECSSAGRVDQISQRQDEHVDVYDQTPLPHGPSRIMASSSSSNSRGVIKVSRAHGHGLQGNVCLSSVAPLRWLGSPITPLPQLGESKIPHEPDSDSRLYEILEDDTPDILKETHTPIKAFKASSPNQKRVSPPHNHMQELRSTSSPSLKSGRKFVLRSISAFPPLTPHSDPKVGSSDK